MKTKAMMLMILGLISCGGSDWSESERQTYEDTQTFFNMDDIEHEPVSVSYRFFDTTTNETLLEGTSSFEDTYVCNKGEYSTSSGDFENLALTQVNCGAPVKRTGDLANRRLFGLWRLELFEHRYNYDTSSPEPTFAGSSITVLLRRGWNRILICDIPLKDNEGLPMTQSDDDSYTTECEPDFDVSLTLRTH